MFRTIFRRQFITYMGTLVICFIILGISLTSVFRNYFINQKTEILKTQGQRIAEAWMETYVRGSLLEMYRRDNTFSNELVTINTYLGVSCFFCKVTESGEMNVYAYTRDIEAMELNRLIDYKELQPVLTGSIVVTTGTLYGTYSENMLIVGYPVIYNNVIYGAVFMNAPLSEVQATTGDVITMTLVCLLAAAAVSFVLIYVSSKTISRPIFEISHVAKIIAAGDFAKRLSVKSRDEVGQLADSFNNMAESLERQEVNRREFISNISHDLRSPLTSMRGFLQAILDGTIPPENQEKYIKIVLDETERLGKLANDIMYIGKFQNFEVELDRTPFDINVLVRKTLIMFEGRINDKNIKIEVSFADEKNMVDADYEKIQRVIYNLIDNAVKFSDIGGKVSVKTAIDDKNPGRLFVKVRDDGPGIPPDEQKMIFERFYKSDKSRGRDKTGSGLGLAIVKEFILAHGETITVTSNTESGADGENTAASGSEFVFSLALAEKQQ